MLTLQEVKIHVRVDNNEEDEMFEMLIAVATAAIENYLGRTFEGEVPAPVKAAALLEIADLYENRERQLDRPLHSNAAYQRLLDPYRVITV